MPGNRGVADWPQRLQELLALTLEAGEPWEEAMSRNDLGHLRMEQGDLAEAEADRVPQARSMILGTIAAVCSRSLIACGSPCIQPRRSPRASSASRRAASASSSSPSRSETIALSAGLTASIRSRQARITSTQDSSRRAIRCESAVASSIPRTLAAQVWR